MLLRARIHLQSIGRSLLLCHRKVISSENPSHYTTTPNAKSKESTLPEHARIVICGGGTIGCSIAYHLTLRGEKDVLIIEKHKIGEGATSYSAGIVGMLKETSTETEMIRYSANLYKELSIKHNLEWVASGAVFLARNHHRLHQFERRHQVSLHTGTRTEMLGREQVLARWPYINDEDLLGAIWIPDDIIVNAKLITKLLADISVQQGARIVEDCSVKDIITDKKSHKVIGIRTSEGEVKCDYFINAAGQWARMLGKLSRPRIGVPIHSVEHYYMLCKPNESFDHNMPVIRDYDNHCYFRRWGDHVMAGAFEKNAKPIFHDGVPDGFNCAKQRLPEDWDHLQFMLDKVLYTLPVLQTAVIQDVVTGTESFTPDRRWILGQTAELWNYYLAAGFCGAGTAAAGGVGQKMATLILDGLHMGWHDLVDVKRFVDLHNNIKYLRARVKEVVGLGYGKDSTNPYVEYESARGLRVSPLYTRAEKFGAVFGEDVGFEQALFFKSNKPEDAFDLLPQQTRFGKPSYFDIVKSEYWACRENVCLVDMSSFAKIEIRSDDINDLIGFLQYVCANDINKPVGSVVHSGMLNENGGYENDCSLFRLDENRFLVISPASQQTRNLWWLKQHLPQTSSIQISDITSMYTVINVIGPKARELLAELTDVSLRVADFPHMTGKPLYVANAGGIIVMRLTHAGEDGFMLYIPSEYALHVYDTLMDVGKDYGVRNAGYYALKALRTEKFFAYWGTDLNSAVTPLECSRDHRVKLATGIDFLGRDALLKQKTEGVRKKFVMFTLPKHDENNDPFTWKGEPIFRNGKYVGNVTSSAYGYTLRQLVCLGFIRNSEVVDGPVTLSYITDKNAEYEIAVGNKLYAAKVYAYPPKIEAANLGFYLPKKVAV